MSTSLTRGTYRSIEERTLVYFAENPRELLEAYVESGEGLDRAGGFAVQVRFPLCPPPHPRSPVISSALDAK